MKRVIFLLFVASLVLPAGLIAQEEHAPSIAQEAREEEARERAEGGGEHLNFFKWINFTLLVGAIGYYARKKGGAFFARRTEMIRRDLDESTRMRKEAEARYADIERRLAAIGAEIESMRSQAHGESAAERERMREDMRRSVEKTLAHAQQEIASAAAAARQELRAHAAELAVRAAEERIRRQLTPEADSGLIAGFAGELQRRSAREAVVR